MKKQRGKFLTIMLFFMTFVAVTGLYTGTKQNYQEFYQNTPTWLASVILLATLLDIAALAGIWFWKKIAVYVYAASTGLGILLEAFILRPTEQTLCYSFFGIFLHGLVFLAVSRKWPYFK